MIKYGHNGANPEKIFNLKPDCGHDVRVYLKPNHPAMQTPHGFAFDGKQAPVALTGDHEFTCPCGVVTKF